MNQPSGTRVVLCPLCGQRYRRNNWMIRRRGDVVRGVLLDDTHKIACAKKLERAIEGRDSR